MLQWLYIIDLNIFISNICSIFLRGYPCSNSKIPYARYAT